MLWSAFYDYVMPDLPGVPQALVDLHLRRTAIDFLRQSGVYTAEIAPVNIVAGTSDYTLVSPVAETEPAFAWSLFADTNKLSPVSLAVLDGSGKWDTCTGQVSLYTQKTPTVVTLYKKPDTSLTGGLTGRIALRPTFTATGVTDWVGQLYVDALALGAKARLMALQSKPWSNPQMAAANMTLYIAARSEAIIDARRTYGNATLQVQLRST
jgi:hypothetical protein